MKKREKILVGLMIVALVYGGYVLFVDQGTPRGSSGRETDPEDALQAYAVATRERIGGLQLTREETRLLDMSVAAWSPSPFFDRLSVAQPVTGRPTDIRYTGFFSVGANRLAIINGREYRENEIVKDTDLLLESIEPERIVLAAPDGGRRLTITREQTVTPGE